MDKYRLTVYHDGGKHTTTYPEAYTLEGARTKAAMLIHDGCEMADPGSPEDMLFYPGHRVWKVIAEKIK